MIIQELFYLLKYYILQIYGNFSFQNVILSNILVILTTLCGVFTIVLWRTLDIGFKRVYPQESDKSKEEDITINDEIVGRLQAALRFRTFSSQPGEFKKLIQFIKDSFKTVHESKLVTMEVVSDYSLLYTVSGSDKSLKPYLLAGHLDVVPAEPNMWVLPPFAGKLKDKYVVGRGAMDFKNGVMGILEALEHLLSKGFEPKRTIYISFGHDKEQGGNKGAAEISKKLQSAGLKKLEFILDQGCTITGEVSGIAMIGVTEKSVLELTLAVKSPGCHPAISHPNVISPLGILVNALTKLENKQHPSMLGKGPEKYMLENLASTMGIGYKILWSNIWLFKPIISRMMSKNFSMNAMIRTVHCVTDIQTEREETESNDIPEKAIARVTCHVHPSQSVNNIISHLGTVINDDRVVISTMYTSRIASMSPHGEDDFGYQTVAKSIQEVFNPYLISPGILVSTTDSEKYHMFTNNIYRFTPIVSGPGDDQRIHGKNERISVTDYGKSINFYKNIILNADESYL